MDSGNKTVLSDGKGFDGGICTTNEGKLFSSLN
ncbi:uncharacterized protein G2W53_038209 [Senna tora]|uniref:Uncharacterized protein n=1 Tax=Senna tora TaxID=362788 RepID=A0A834SKS6_9FABA|nr:uncharacterized protein G2W53_038209 [Senna tora]